MSYKLTNPNETFEYISPNDPDKNNPTVWILGALDAYTRSKLKDILVSSPTSAKRANEQDSPLRLGTFSLEIVKFGLKGWKNLLDRGSKEIEYRQDILNIWGRSYPVVSEKLLELLPDEIITELSDVIYKANSLTTEERKN